MDSFESKEFEEFEIHSVTLRPFGWRRIQSLRAFRPTLLLYMCDNRHSNRRIITFFILCNLTALFYMGFCKYRIFNINTVFDVWLFIECLLAAFWSLLECSWQLLGGKLESPGSLFKSLLRDFQESLQRHLRVSSESLRSLLRDS